MSDEYGRDAPSVPDRPVQGVRSGQFVPRRDARTSRRPHLGRLAGALVVIGLAAALLGLLGSTLFSDATGGIVFELAKSNPSLLHLAPVAQIVGTRLEGELDAPAGTDPTVVHFQVPLGASATDVARDLARAGLLKDQFALTYLAVTGGLSGQIEAGAYDLNATMTPRAILARLQQAPVVTVPIQLREGLRLEQITAYLETRPLRMDVRQFYDEAMHPPATLLADYPFLSTLPAGRSLEGFLGAGTFEVYQDVTPDEIIRDLLDLWKQEIGEAQVQAAQKAGRNFYQVLSLASLVEQEARVASERPLIAGVYTNRLAKGMLLQSDPTVIYASDTVQLRKTAFSAWKDYVFWNAIGDPATVKVPKDLAAFQTYEHAGMIPGPICTPSAASVAAALNPDTATGYLYFVAKGDGTFTHAFARTYQEQLANMKKYGYIP